MRRARRHGMTRENIFLSLGSTLGINFGRPVLKMIFFAEMRALFASPRADYSSEFGLTFNNRQTEQEVHCTSRAEKTLQGEVSDVTIEN